MTVFKPQMMAGLMSRSGFLTVPCSLVPRERYGVTHLPLLFLFCLSSLLKVRSSVLAWKIPWTEEPCGLQSVGSWRVRTLWAAEHVGTCAHAHNPLNGRSPHTSFGSLHARIHSCFFPPRDLIHTLLCSWQHMSFLGKEDWCFSFTESWCFLCLSVHFPLWLCSSPVLVFTDHALLWAFCLYKLDLACYGSAILFWLSLWYSAFCRRQSQAHYVEIMFAA